jgi:hypothetical protein
MWFKSHMSWVPDLTPIFSKFQLKNNILSIFLELFVTKKPTDINQVQSFLNFSIQQKNQHNLQICSTPLEKTIYPQLYLP